MLRSRRYRPCFPDGAGSAQDTSSQIGSIEAGRRYQLSGEGGFLGIDLGGTEVKYVVLDAGHVRVAEGTFHTRGEEGREAVMGRLTDLVKTTHRSTPLQALGIAIPGVLDLATGRVELMTNLTHDWNGFPLREEMRRRTGLPAFPLNDVRAATLAELHAGAGRGYRDFLCVAIGTGIGGGLVLGGRLFMGSRGAAGEIGHQTMQPDGPRCNCGNHGCLETLASATAIARRGRQAIEAGDRALAEAAGSDHPSTGQLAMAAAHGNDTARAIFVEAGTWVGLAMANLVVALNPQAVVIGGGVAAAGELLLGPIRDEITRRTIVFSAERGGVDVLQSPLGGLAGAIGAAEWAAQRGQEAAV